VLIVGLFICLTKRIAPQAVVMQFTDTDAVGKEDTRESEEDVEDRNRQDGSVDGHSASGYEEDDSSTNESNASSNRASSSSMCLDEDTSSPTDTEATGPSAGCVISEPFFDDVVGGRGKYSNNHFGNQKYRRLVRDHCEEYHRLATNAHKSRFAESIVARVKQDGGRFLKQLDNARGFVEMSDFESRKKVGQVSLSTLARTSTILR